MSSVPFKINIMSSVPFKINIDLLDYVNNYGIVQGLLLNPNIKHE